jgi:hypothetical protein
MFEKMTRPCSIAEMIEAKLSSVSTMSAVCFVTSVPVMPIAMPMSARFRAGASFTPSPVMPTTCPFFFRASTMRTLCWGETRAKTLVVSSASASSASLSASISAPETAPAAAGRASAAPPAGAAGIRPMFRPMAAAVSL